jgi:hypothetical protein
MKLKSDLIKHCESNETIVGLLELFTEDFLIDFEMLLKKQRIPVMKALPYLYRMWYYSALIDETPLSPANFINSQVRDKYTDDNLAVPVVKAILDKKGLKDFAFDFKIFNIDNHPVLEDLKLFLEACTPDIGVDENGLLLEGERDKFINSLSFKEIFYTTFLTNISYELKLLRKMPSIGVHRSTPVPGNIISLYKLTKEKQLKQIIDATLSIASKNLCQVFTIDRKTFSKESLYNLIRNATDMSEFINYIYKKFNMNIDDLDLEYLEELDFESVEDFEDLDVAPESLMAITLRMDIEFLFDAYLLTPLGYYLQLIQPIYINGINFFRHFEELLEADRLNLPLIKLFFRMPNGFDITSLGEKLLLEGKTPKNSYQKLIGDIDYNEIYKQILDSGSVDEGDEDIITPLQKPY